MNPIELGKAIAEDGIEIITAVMLILVVGLVWYLIKRQTKREDKHDKERFKREEKREEEQKEGMLFIRKLVTNDIKELHQDNAKYAELYSKSIGLLKGIGGSQKKLCKLIESVDRKINGQKK